MVHCPTKHKCTCCYTASVGHTVAYGCNEWLALSVVVWYVVYTPQALCGGIALAPWQQLRGLAHRPRWHICSCYRGAKGVLRGVVGQHIIGLRCTATVLHLVYIPSTLHWGIAFAQWQVWAGLAYRSNAAARVAPRVVWRLVGEHIVVPGRTLAVVYIV